MRWAREDLALALDDVDKDDLVARGPCMWAHQAGEKAIKALLIARDIDPPKRHDLDALCARLPSDDAAPLLELRLPDLTQWAIDGRYPDDFVEATHEHARRAVELARRVIATVEQRLAAELPP